MITRGTFITRISGGIIGLSLPDYAWPVNHFAGNNLPVVISTWRHGVAANETAWKILSDNGYALDAVEAGVRVSEADPGVNSVGYGGIPDASGKVTLDASIMDEKGRAGSVSYLQHIKHPISVARLVMEKTPHVMLSGRGALKFAMENGFNKEKLLTNAARQRWKRWKTEEKVYKPEINSENQEGDHDTISMLAVDSESRICGACTTSGLAFKMHGRVGDSPIIGAGLFVDGETGAAAATGTGELVMKTLGSFLVVENMRNGMTPFQACEAAIIRITKKIPDFSEYQVGFIALSKSGEYGAASISPGFEYAVATAEFTGLKEADSWMKAQ
ncbi:MAG: N(4)-(beta-N-acetylglucosaminyl)-L-asparaginase [Prolixibacteraceae bacterium]|nr:N(4)-(beta-N-acetylglucosaminyl)-L-asparaginase [Prolixibacteraceae bacterium]